MNINSNNNIIIISIKFVSEELEYLCFFSRLFVRQ